MPTLDPIGRVANPEEELDFEPVTIPIVAYTKDKKEVVKEVRFRGVMPTGAALEVLRSITVNRRGEQTVPPAVVMAYLDAAVLPEDVESFREFISDSAIYIEQTTLFECYVQLTEWYSERPTRRQSGSRGSPAPTRRTSQAAARSRASTTSKRSTSGKR
jgi:hypothetical protein